jgi:hypothetical protein
MRRQALIQSIWLLYIIVRSLIQAKNAIKHYLITVLGQQVTPDSRVNYASNVVKETKSVKYFQNISPIKKKQVKEAKPKDVFIENQNDEETNDAETAPDFLEGDIAIPEVN